MMDIRNQNTRLRWSTVSSYLLAFIKLAMALLTSSFFVGVNSIYNALIGFGKHQCIKGSSINDEEIAIKYYKRVGKVIMIASVVYIAYTLRLFQQNITPRYEMIPALAIAAVTFFEITFSFFGIIKARRNNDTMRKAVKLLNLSSALIGLTLTQTALLSYVSTKNYYRENAVSGLLFGIIVLIIGSRMVLKKQVNKKCSN